MLLLIAEGLDELFKIWLGQLQLPDLHRRLVLECGVSNRFKAVDVDLVAVDDSRDTKKPLMFDDRLLDSAGKRGNSDPSEKTIKA